MKIRNVLGLAVTVPALVVTLAQPSNAASQGVVTFAGTIRVVAGTPQTVSACFTAVAPCPEGVPSSGAATGVGSAAAIDGLFATMTLSVPCTPTVPVDPAKPIQLTVHDTLSGNWSPRIDSSLAQFGTVAVVNGPGATGAALLTPVGLPACGAPITVAISGSLVVAY